MKIVELKSWDNCTPTNITATLSEFMINKMREKLASIAMLDHDIESLVVKMSVEVKFEVDGVSYTTTIDRLVVGKYWCDFLTAIAFEWGDEYEEVLMTSFTI